MNFSSFAIMLIQAFVLTALSSACRSSSTPNQSGASSVSIKELDAQGFEFDRYEFEMKGVDDPTFKMPVKKFKKGSGVIEVKVPVGTYTIRLDYYLKDRLVLGADLCPAAKKTTTQTFVAGPNDVMMLICAASGGSEVATSKASFSIKDGVLYDKSGKAFVMRGINMPTAYFYDKSLEAISQVKSFGFNTVRIVWCADTLLTHLDRCNNSHVRPVADLDNYLAKLKQFKLVAVLNLQNATGSDSPSELQQLINYLVRPEIKKVLDKYQDMLLINLANEWYGSWDKSAVYADAYKSMIAQMRKAGLVHTLVIDAKGYGQDFSSIPENASALLAVDKNLLFSVHIYDVFKDADMVKESFATIRKQKLPVIVGEFACSHGPRGPVPCEAVMSEAENADFKVGTIAWSYAGNDSSLSDLDLVDVKDWKTLSAFGKTIVESTFGVRSTSREACMFAASCP